MWTAVGLKEAEYLLNNYKELNKYKYTIKICIDQANGHMSKLLELCSKLKDKFNKISIMTGNIANPNTYEIYARHGIDYVRVGIGGGNACTTSVQTGIHFPMGSLLTNIFEEKQKVSINIKLGVKYKSLPKIVADGGISRIDQVVKALALGADYVMLGKVFAQTDEACGDCESYFSTLENKYVTYREYFGMSTEKAQELINKASLFPVENFQPKHTEGQVQSVKISYSLNDWVNDFKHALKSCMSYNNSKKLDQFIGKVRYNTMSISTFNNYMK
jgi:IMP dehydrogenase/GMP reductase